MRKTLTIASTVLLVITVFNFVRTYQRLSGVEGEIQGLRDEVVSLEQEKKRLEALKAEAQTPEFVERELREKLGYGREGEIILVLPEQESSLKSQVTNPNESEENMENWERWMIIFGFR